MDLSSEGISSKTSLLETCFYMVRMITVIGPPVKYQRLSDEEAWE